MEPSVPNMTSPPPARVPKAYALRFISGKYQGGEFPLPDSKEIVVGRSSELDMVLVEDMVSRRHAKISVVGDQIFIQDLGSTNGTFVNGEKVKRTRLQEGDRILIGTSIIKLVAADSASSAPEGSPSNLEDLAASRRTSQVRTMSGSIAEIPLPDLMQLFGASKKSGVLVIRTEHDTGKVFFDTGAVVYATINDNYDIAPQKSLFRILTWNDGTFDMDPPEEREFLEPISMSTEGILMEAMRQIDELRRIGPELPPRNANIALSMPMISQLRELQPEELDVLQLAYNYGHVETIMNKSTASDLDTGQSLVKLLKEGYIRIE